MGRSKGKRPALLGLAVAASVAAPAFAHHSYAMFDTAKSVTLNGTVREFQWTNPHAWIQLLVRDPATGKDVEWSIELAAPTLMTRSGWSRTALKAGDKATVVIHPLKSGQIGGAMVSTTVDGRPVGDGPRAAP